MIDKLIPSKPRVKILSLLFQNIRKSYYAREIIRMTGEDGGNITRELENLFRLGLLNSKRLKGVRYYFLNKKNRYFPSFRSLFSVYNKENVQKEQKEKVIQEPKLRYLNDSDPWILGEDIPDIDLFFSQIWLTCFANEFGEKSGINYQKIMTLYKGYHLWFYFGKDDSKKVGDFLVERFLKDPHFTVLVNKKIVEWSDTLRQFSDNIQQDNFSTCSNKRLWEIYKEHHEIHTEYYQWGWIPVAVDMFHNNLTEKLKAYLRSIDLAEDKINTNLVILTQPTKKSLIQIEQDDFLKLGIGIQKDKTQFELFRKLYKNFQEQEAATYGLKTHTPQYESMLEAKVELLKKQIKPEIYQSIYRHFQNYFYVKFMWIGKQGVYSFDYYLKELVKLLATGVDLRKKWRVQEKEWKDMLSQRKELIKKLNIQKLWKIILDSWGDFMVTKIYRRFAQIYAVYQMQPVLQEIAKRLGLNLMQVRFMLKNEVQDALSGKEINYESLRRRTRFCIFYTEKDREVIFIGDEAKKLRHRIQMLKKINAEEVMGQTGSVGTARGIVKTINRPSAMIKMHKGDILVSIATKPDIVGAMKKAAAIVTDQGGITSHAAIVARELGIPCVIATKIATKIFKDGDNVEVDADKGLVKKIS